MGRDDAWAAQEFSVAVLQHYRNGEDMGPADKKSWKQPLLLPSSAQNDALVVQ